MPPSKPFINYESSLKNYLQRLEQALDVLLPASTVPSFRLHEAMRYSLEAGGKRLRPMLLLAILELFPAKEDPLPAALALECVHTFSLIHDDMPCMDNSPLRRGKPTNHVVFDEATALLAGLGLLNHAFLLCSRHYGHAPKLAHQLVSVLSWAISSEQMLGGQMEDILLTRPHAKPNQEQLEFIYARKTGALLSASLLMGGHMAEIEDAEKIKSLKNLGYHLGLAFQITDDLLDVVSTREMAGKPVALELQGHAVTYPMLCGVEKAQQKAQEHIDAALSILEHLHPQAHDSFLAFLVKKILNRVR